MQAALDELYGLGHDHGDREAERYEAVTSEQVRDAARRCLVADKAVVSIIRGRPGKA
jgi:predicted Zn-dependent peptidase